MWKKVIALSAVVSLLWIAAGGVTTYYITWLDRTHNKVLSDNVATIKDCGTMLETLWKLEALVMDAAQRGHSDFRKEVPQFEETFIDSLEEAKKNSTHQEEHELVASIEKHFDLYRSQIHRRLEPAAATSEVPPTVGETVHLADEVAKPCKLLLELNENLMHTSREASSRLSTAVNWLRISLLLLGPAVGIFFGFSVAHSLRRSISQISVTLRDATGELEEHVGRVDVSPSGDLPALRQQVQVVSGRIRQVMDELQQARRNAVRSERLAAVGELAAGVAHGLRNPLTSVKLLIQTAAQKQPDRRLGDKQLQVVLEEIARMENTIQGLLDLAGPPKLRRVQHDLRDTVRRALNLVEGRALQQQVALVEELPAEPAIIEGDAEQLHQVFINLLLNGIEAMVNGGELRVTLVFGAPGSNFCSVIFSDTGSGIPQAMLNKIFEPFITSKERGTGLGLPISRRVVLEHGGDLSAANRPEGGAVFTVELPLRSSLPEPVSAGVQSGNGAADQPLPHFDTETFHA